VLPLLAIGALGAGLAAFTYFRLEALGRRALVPLAFRAMAWSSLGVLLADLSCARPAGSPGRPIVLLDRSLSMLAAGSRGDEAVDSARRWGEVRGFGDERPAGDTAARGRSLLAPAVAAAMAGGRPVLVVTDGELEDAGDLTREQRAAIGVRVFPRRPAPDLAVTSVSGPGRLTIGDTLRVEASVRGLGGPLPDSVRLELRTERVVLARRSVRVARSGELSIQLSAPTTGLVPGDLPLTVAIADAHDAEPRDDARLLLLTLAETPGVVLIADPPDWDSRFLYRTVREVAQLPVRGFARVESGRWRDMGNLAMVPAAEVARAARRADLLILKGDPAGLDRGAHARGVLNWPSGESGETVLPGDWYLSASPSSPLAGALVGAPIDSFPPAVQLTPMEAGPHRWIALSAQDGRRGAERPVIIGGDSGGRRRVTVAADGLWRWAFMGGSSEQAYRSLVATTVTWLLGGADSARGRARPVRPVVMNSRPVVFEWTAPGRPSVLRVSLAGPDGARSDSLRFDGSGRASLWLPVGRYRYQLEGGGAGMVAVETYSDEWLPREVALEDRPTPAVAEARRVNARQWPWLFGLCVLGLAGEWIARRRLGLR